MREITPRLAAALARQATTFCHAWKIQRADGRTLGFTDHDGAFAFDGVAFASSSGADASERESSLGFAAGGADLVAALDSPLLDEEALVNGRYDGARVETWLIDWTDPETRLLLDVHTLGEVRREGAIFNAELRGLAHRLDETRGRTFRASCDADFCDARCGLDLALWSIEAQVVAVNADGAICVDAGEHETGAFTQGRVVFTSGRHEGLARGVRSHRRDDALHSLTLWSELTPPPEPGDSLRLSAGCDKSFATCRDRFGNAVNFRGCPHMPGNDYVMSYPSASDIGASGALAR